MGGENRWFHESDASGGGSVAPASAVTGADGRAGTRWTLGPVPADSQRLAASTVGAGGAAVTVRATATAVAGNVFLSPFPAAHEGSPGQTLADSLIVAVYHGTLPVAGVPVQWSTDPGSGTVARAVRDQRRRGGEGRLDAGPRQRGSARLRHGGDAEGDLHGRLRVDQGVDAEPLSWRDGGRHGAVLRGGPEHVPGAERDGPGGRALGGAQLQQRGLVDGQAPAGGARAGTEDHHGSPSPTWRDTWR